MLILFLPFVTILYNTILQEVTLMIFSFWQEHLDEFLDSMCEQGFCTKVISAHKQFTLSLEEDATVHGWQTYEDVRNYYSLLPGLKDKTRWFKLSIIKKLEAFHLLGQKPEHRIVKEHVHVTAPTRSKGRLNLFPLRDQLDDFLAFFIQQGRCDETVLSTRRTVSYIITMSASNSWDTYQDIKDWYFEKKLTTKYLDKIYRIIDHMEYWQLNGTLIGWDDHGMVNVRKRRFLTVPDEKMSVEPSLGDFDLSYVQSHLDEFLECMKDRGYSESSLKVNKNNLKRIIMLSRSIRWDSIDEILEWNERRPISTSHMDSTRKTLEKLSCWLSTGDVPEHPSIQMKLESRVQSLGELDLSFWQDHLDGLLAYMKDHGYCEDYRKKLYFHTRRFVILSREVEWNSYEDIWNWFSSRSFGKCYLHDIRSILGILDEFHRLGIMPNNRATQNPLCPRGNCYSKLVPEYKALVDYACEDEKRRGLKPNTIKCTKTKASSFLYSLQQRRVERLIDVAEEDVLAFFYTDGVYLRGQSTASRISLFFRTCAPLNPKECRRIGMYVPKFHSSRKTIQYLTTDEIHKFRKALNDEGNGLSYKERAIGTIIFYTGMRCSDVSCLKLDSVDLKHRTISFTQEKTGNPVVLPLSTVVGNAIYDYCTIERPHTDSLYLFLCDAAPYNTLGKGGIEWAVTKIMMAAGIRQEEGDRKGGHIFRHHAASTMAAGNIPSPVISATLGHSSPKSLDAYLYADMEHIRECSISLKKYTVSKEVFSLG